MSTSTLSIRSNRLELNCIAGLIGAALIAGVVPANGAPPQHSIDLSHVCSQSGGSVVPAGSAEEAETYYQGLSNEIAFKSSTTIDNATLDDLFVFLGYKAQGTAAPLNAAEVQNESPDDLMNPSLLSARLGGIAISSGDVLSARFFAPKISDVSGGQVTQAGWRKLVRFHALRGSIAQQHGIASAFVLYNFFADIKSTSPFANADSVNTQTILIATTPGFSPIYWLDFGTTSSGAKLSNQLDAFFDAGHVPASLTQAQGGKIAYFVPCACISCHGGLQLNLGVRPPAPMPQFDKAMLDYLDTDHWLDRVQPGEDFALLGSSTVPDASGFDTIRKINAEIEQQNASVQPGSTQDRAAQHWLDLHKTNSGHVSDLTQRTLVSPGQQPWSASNPNDLALLAKLNHYCFRCHGSVEFDVFDRSMVIALKSQLNAVLRPREETTAVTGDPRSTMPPDRDLTPDELETLRQYINSLH